MANSEKKTTNNIAEPWKIHLVDTGQNTLTGGRIKRVADLIGNETFLLTYGDAVSDVNITELVKFHKKNKKLISMTAIQPDGRFGALDIDDAHIVRSFNEKPKGDGTWINGGYFVCEPEVINYIGGDKTIFEQEPLSKLASEGKMVAFKHHSFWQCMDSMRDKNVLLDLWESGKAPWKLWED